MLISLESLINKWNLNIRKVIHIGAHFGEESSIYTKLGLYNTIYFEPLSKVFNILINNIQTGDIALKCALGSHFESNIKMYVDNGECASSSILRPEKHLINHPTISFPYEELVTMDTLDASINKLKTDKDPAFTTIDFNEYNFINIDVQGYELEVFKGAINTLKQIDYIYTEVNRDEVYANCVQVEQLDEFLANCGFNRVETSWDGGMWGDALYLYNSPRIMYSTT